MKSRVRGPKLYLHYAPDTGTCQGTAGSISSQWQGRRMEMRGKLQNDFPAVNPRICSSGNAAQVKSCRTYATTRRWARRRASKREKKRSWAMRERRECWIYQGKIWERDQAYGQSLTRRTSCWKSNLWIYRIIFWSPSQEKFSIWLISKH